MFDRATAASIQSAPRLRGVNPERLAAELTDAHVQVSVASSLLGQVTGNVDEGHFGRLLSIARVQEALALVLEESVLRQAAAHVAARAYQVVALRSPEQARDFTASSIPTSVSSMLLFIAADATADAQEMARQLRSSDQSLESALVSALKGIGQSDFRSVAAIELPTFSLPQTTSPHEISAYVGYYNCAVALIEMGSALLHVDRSEWKPGAFANIRDQMKSAFSVNADQGPVNADDTIAGPWHLATLLDLAESVLVYSSITSVGAPAGVPEPSWVELVERLARRRPTLWRNHRDAVERGFLVAGTSAVVTFPTGAGKSTVAELKVAATAISGRNVIFLVPTLSLLDQQAKALRSALPDVQIVAQRDIDDLSESSPQSGASVFVLTPESCLASLSSDPERFGEIGLVMFDEAHLLNSASEIPQRRAIDATLCLLLLASRYQSADIFLISAMIGNADPLREWLTDLTGRAAIALNNPWKPTRQARGAVVYRADDLEQLQAMINDAASTSTTEGAPAALLKKVSATPYGFFGLQTTWQSTHSRDYRWLPLLGHEVRLSVSGRRSQAGWQLSSNQNQVASAIAVSGAASGKKVLVFAQQVKWAVSTANQVNSDSASRTSLNAGEQALLARAIEAAGSSEVLYGDFEGDQVIGDALPHHGLLLREERRLHESLYRRENGIPVLVATSTLAQGMNFPSEIVVIAGDRRFDTTTNRLQRLEAQELLNAAGRAGRAGMQSSGLVIVVPSYPVGYDGRQQMGPGWFQLQQAFSQADQCVEVTDPLTTLLMGEPSEESELEVTYLARRLVTSDEEDEAHQLIFRSFGAFQIRRSGRVDELEQRLAAIPLAADMKLPPWVRASVASTGLAPDGIAHLGQSLRTTLPLPADLWGWKEWFVEILREYPEIMESALHAGSRAAFKGAPDELGQEWQRLGGKPLVETANVFLSSWMKGANLQDLQLLGEEKKLTRTSKKCEFSRKFVLRVVPDLAYIFGLPWLVAKSMGLRDELGEYPIAHLSRAIELGVDSLEKLEYLGSSVMRSRIDAHRHFESE